MIFWHVIWVAFVLGLPSLPKASSSNNHPSLDDLVELLKPEFSIIETPQITRDNAEPQPEPQHEQPPQDTIANADAVEERLTCTEQKASRGKFLRLHNHVLEALGEARFDYTVTMSVFFESLKVTFERLHSIFEGNGGVDQAFADAVARMNDVKMKRVFPCNELLFAMTGISDDSVPKNRGTVLAKLLSEYAKFALKALPTMKGVTFKENGSLNLSFAVKSRTKKRKRLESDVAEPPRKRQTRKTTKSSNSDADDDSESDNVTSIKHVQQHFRTKLVALYNRIAKMFDGPKYRPKVPNEKFLESVKELLLAITNSPLNYNNHPIHIDYPVTAEDMERVRKESVTLCLFKKTFPYKKLLQILCGDVQDGNANSFQLIPPIMLWLLSYGLAVLPEVDGVQYRDGLVCVNGKWFDGNDL